MTVLESTMFERKTRGNRDFHKVLLTLLWVALALGVFVSFWEARSDAAQSGAGAVGADAIGAAMAAGVYVTGFGNPPPGLPSRHLDSRN